MENENILTSEYLDKGTLLKAKTLCIMVKLIELIYGRNLTLRLFGDNSAEKVIERNSSKFFSNAFR